MKKGDWKRILKQFGIGALIGGSIGIVASYFGMDHRDLGISQDTVISYLVPIFRTIAIISLLVGLYFFYRSVKEFKEYQLDEGDDNDALYRSFHRKYNYTGISLGIAFVLALLSFSIGIKLKYGPDYFEMFFSIIEFVIIVLVGIIQSKLLKFYGQIRGIDMTTQPTLKELKNNIMQNDEAEMLANYKMSFDIVMNLSGLILPSLYALLLLISVITGRIELTGYLVVAGLHLYIMIMNYKVIKEYYK